MILSNENENSVPIVVAHNELPRVAQQGFMEEFFFPRWNFLFFFFLHLSLSEEEKLPE
jgi:hypothetical protein